MSPLELRLNAKRARRGQAVVETALALLVFISILMFGVFFSEVTVAGMKVTEAAQSALWDATAGKHHEIPTQYEDPVEQRLSDAMDDATDRYQDFDGRQVAAGAEPKLVFSAAKDLEVECERGDAITHRGTAPLALIYRDNGGVSCSAEAMVSVRNMPRSFDEGGDGHFKVKHQDGNALQAGIKLCAMGRPATLNGDCDGEMAMMLDDWGLSKENDEEEQCELMENPGPFPVHIPCENASYQSAAALLYYPATLAAQRRERAAHVRLIRGVLPGTTPVQYPGLGAIDAFHMSFKGEEDLFFEASLATSWRRVAWPTTPYTAGSKFPIYAVSYLKRESCYLGLECNESTLDEP